MMRGLNHGKQYSDALTEAKRTMVQDAGIVRHYMIFQWTYATCYCCMAIYFSMVNFRRVKPAQIACFYCQPFLRKAWSMERKTNPNLRKSLLAEKDICEACPLVDFQIALAFPRCRDCRAWARAKKSAGKVKFKN